MANAISIAVALPLAGVLVAVLVELLDPRSARARNARRAAIELGFARSAALLLVRAGVPVAVAVGAPVEARPGEREPVGALSPRRDAFLAAGLGELAALEAAAGDLAVEEFHRLLERGCPPELALRILR